jgi:HPt (histidine-containing phosphotransfer) domain-containing protein
MGRTPYRLPETLTASLERAFAGEVAERLPRLLAAADELSACPRAAGRVVSDAHALASSAAVVGADRAAVAARECEQLLTPYARDGVVPASIVDRAADAAEEMRAALSSWHEPRTTQLSGHRSDQMADTA